MVEVDHLALRFTLSTTNSQVYFQGVVNSPDEVLFTRATTLLPRAQLRGTRRSYIEKEVGLSG